MPPSYNPDACIFDGTNEDMRIAYENKNKGNESKKSSDLTYKKLGTLLYTAGVNINLLDENVDPRMVVVCGRGDAAQQLPANIYLVAKAEEKTEYSNANTINQKRSIVYDILDIFNKKNPNNGLKGGFYEPRKDRNEKPKVADEKTQYNKAGQLLRDRTRGDKEEYLKNNRIKGKNHREREREKKRKQGKTSQAKPAVDIKQPSKKRRIKTLNEEKRNNIVDLFESTGIDPDKLPPQIDLNKVYIVDINNDRNNKVQGLPGNQLVISLLDEKKTIYNKPGVSEKEKNTVINSIIEQINADNGGSRGGFFLLTDNDLFPEISNDIVRKHFKKYLELSSKSNTKSQVNSSNNPYNYSTTTHQLPEGLPPEITVTQDDTTIISGITLNNTEKETTTTKIKKGSGNTDLSTTKQKRKPLPLVSKESSTQTNNSEVFAEEDSEGKLKSHEEKKSKRNKFLKAEFKHPPNSNYKNTSLVKKIKNSTKVPDIGTKEEYTHPRSDALTPIKENYTDYVRKRRENNRVFDSSNAEHREAFMKILSEKVDLSSKHYPDEQKFPLYKIIEDYNGSIQEYDDQIEKVKKKRKNNKVKEIKMAKEEALQDIFDHELVLVLMSYDVHGNINEDGKGAKLHEIKSDPRLGSTTIPDRSLSEGEEELKKTPNEEATGKGFYPLELKRRTTRNCLATLEKKGKPCSNMFELIRSDTENELLRQQREK